MKTFYFSLLLLAVLALIMENLNMQNIPRITCCNNLFSCTQLNNCKLFSLLSNQSFCNTDSIKNFFVLNSIRNLSVLLKKFNSFMPNPNSNPENFVNCKCYDISQIKNLL